MIVETQLDNVASAGVERYLGFIGKTEDGSMQ